MAKRIGKASSRKNVRKAPDRLRSSKRAAAADSNGIGHNSTGAVIPKRQMKEFFDRLDRISDAKETDNAKHMADIKAVYDEAKDKLGVKSKLVRMYYQKHRAELKFDAAMEAFDANERDDADRLMAAGASFGEQSPFGRWCLAQGEKRTGTEDEVDQRTINEQPEAFDN